MNMMDALFRSESESTPIPSRSTIGSCGYDFYSPEDYDLVPGEWTTINTDIRLNHESIFKRAEIRPNWFILLAPRSGLGAKYGFRLRNTVGIIDMDYGGDILASVSCDTPFTLEKGQRFMQGIIMDFHIDPCETPVATERVGGHGSTGKF